MSTRTALRLWLVVRPPGATPGSTGRLFWRDMETPFLPRAGDDVMILRAPESGDWDMGIPIRRIYWTADGDVDAELLDVYVDPDTDMQAVLFRSAGLPRRATSWYTGRDGGDLPERLVASGWTDAAVAGVP